MIKKPVAMSLSPNVEFEDVTSAITQVLSPWAYFQNQHTETLEKWFRKFFSLDFAFSFNSGRSALFAALSVAGIKKGDEVVVQAFTCVAVPNSVIATGAKPIYTDINNSLTIDIDDLEKKISKRTKAIIIQHTFGIPADLEKILSLAKRNNIYVIEDCAHTIGAMFKNKKLGTFGDISIFSFGRDKAFSSVFGGMVITDNKEFGKKLKNIQSNSKSPSFLWVLQQLFHPIAFSLILPLYNFLSLGKILLVVFQKAKMLSFPVFKEEKKGKMDSSFVRKMPNQLAFLALLQLNKLSKYNKKRIKISGIYQRGIKKENITIFSSEAIPFLRFPVILENRDEFIINLRRKGIYLGKWYSNVIDPVGVDLEKVYYKKGTSPKAEYIADRIVNLPTYPTMNEKDAEKIVTLYKKYAQN